MNKNSNTLFGSKQNNTVVKNIVEAEPMMFGVPTESNKVGVKFAVHKSGNTIATGAEGQLVFNVLENNTGVIYLGDEVVSSKILNVTAEQKGGNAKEGIKTITVSYVGREQGATKDSVLEQTFEVVNAAAVESYISDFQTTVFNPYKTATDASIARIDTSVNNLETWAKTADNLKEAANGAITVTPADGANGFKTWTVGTKVDGKTIVVKEDKLATDVTVTIGDGNNSITKIEEVKNDDSNVVTINYTGGVQVINTTGAELPSTGSFGTFMFVFMGTLTVLVCGILLVTKFRMSKISA